MCNEAKIYTNLIEIVRYPCYTPAMQKSDADRRQSSFSRFAPIGLLGALTVLGCFLLLLRL
jgi:hypothetical protein